MTRPSTVLEPTRPPVPPGRAGGGLRPGDGRDPGGGPAANALGIVVWLLVGTVTIFFAAITSALLARRAEGEWLVGPLPDVMWLGTAVLIASSAAVEWSQRRGVRGDRRGLRTGLVLGTALGGIFLALQWTAWRQLGAMGVFLADSPHSAFFYLLTGVHGLHIVGGLAGLTYALARVLGGDGPVPPAVGAARVFWHFLTVLWLYVLAILFVL